MPQLTAESFLALPLLRRHAFQGGRCAGLPKPLRVAKSSPIDASGVRTNWKLAAGPWMGIGIAAHPGRNVGPGEYRRGLRKGGRSGLSALPPAFVGIGVRT